MSVHSTSSASSSNCGSFSSSVLPPCGAPRQLSPIESLPIDVLRRIHSLQAILSPEDQKAFPLVCKTFNEAISLKGDVKLIFEILREKFGEEYGTEITVFEEEIDTLLTSVNAKNYNRILAQLSGKLFRLFCYLNDKEPTELRGLELRLLKEPVWMSLGWIGAIQHLMQVEPSKARNKSVAFLVKGLTREHKFEEVIEMMKLLKNYDEAGDLTKSIIQGLCEDGQVDRAIDLVKEMENNYGNFRDLALCSIASALIKLNRLEDAIEMNDQITNTVAFQATRRVSIAEAFLAAGSLDKALQYSQILRQDDLEKIQIGVAKVLVKQDLNRAIEIIKGIRGGGRYEVQTAILTELCEKQDYQQAIALTDAWEGRYIALQKSIVLSSLIERGRLDEAVPLLKKWDRSLEPVLKAICSSGRFDLFDDAIAIVKNWPDERDKSIGLRDIACSLCTLGLGLLEQARTVADQITDEFFKGQALSEISKAEKAPN